MNRNERRSIVASGMIDELVASGLKPSWVEGYDLDNNHKVYSKKSTGERWSRAFSQVGSVLRDEKWFADGVLSEICVDNSEAAAFVISGLGWAGKDHIEVVVGEDIGSLGDIGFGQGKVLGLSPRIWRERGMVWLFDQDRESVLAWFVLQMMNHQGLWFYSRDQREQALIKSFLNGLPGEVKKEFLRVEAKDVFRIYFDCYGQLLRFVRGGSLTKVVEHY